MDQWEGTIISAPSSRIQTYLGLSNSVHDRDVWQQFLRLSKDFHDKLTIDTTASWGAIEPSVKVNLRRELKELCAENGLFTERDPEPAMEWRLYQLQRNRRAESRKGKPGWSSFSVHIPEANTEVVTATESVSESPTVPETSDSAHKGGHYDPVRDV